MPIQNVNLAALKDKIRENGTIEIELSDGTTIQVPPVALWPDDAAMDRDGIFKVLGDDQAELFIADGGTIQLLVAATQEGQRATAGESEASTDS